MSMSLMIEQLAAAGARVAGELAALHEGGQVHGAVDAGHVVLQPPAAVELRPNVGGNGDVGPYHDVAALGHLLLEAMGADDPAAALRLLLNGRDRTGWRRFIPAPAGASPAARLRELAMEAAAATATGPTAAEVASKLGHLAQGGSGWAQRLATPPSRVRNGAVVAMAAAALVGLSILWSPAGGGQASPRTEPRPAPAVASAPTARQRTAAPAPSAVAEAPPRPAPRLWPSPQADGACPDAGPLGADVDGDGCPEAVEVEAGVIRAGWRRWAVGSAGDVVALGDWNCDGATTPAVLRPQTGGVFVFDLWAPSAEPHAARPVRVVPGAVGLEARGCGHAAVLLSDRSVLVVATRAAR